MDASPITPDLDEALRYAGVRAGRKRRHAPQMAEIAAQCMKTVTPRCTYRVSEIAWENGMPSLFGGQLVLPGRTAAVMLRSCSTRRCSCAPSAQRSMHWRGRYRRGILRMRCCWTASAARMSKRAATRRSAKSPRNCPASTTDRFSPGYGDLPLDVQSPLLALTDATRRLGVTSANRT